MSFCEKIKVERHWIDWKTCIYESTWGEEYHEWAESSIVKECWKNLGEKKIQSLKSNYLKS